MEKGPQKSDRPGPEEWLLKQSRFIKEFNPPDPELLVYEGLPLEPQVEKAADSILIAPSLKEKIAPHLINYLKAPTIKVKFPDRYDEHVFEQDIEHDAGSLGADLYRSNRLREENIKGVINTANLFAGTIFFPNPEMEDSITEKVKDILDLLRGKYEKKPFQEKLAIAEKATILAREVCTSLVEFARKG
jgi:hypothetical protein